MLQPQQTPLVSCIMPTANRRRFAPEAIRMFLAQDYPDKELVVLDDGEDPVGDLIPTHPQIRYIRAQKRQSIGAKRNLACQEARGDIILHWDDDDWYAPTRIRYQVESLIDAQADLCGIDRVFFVEATTSKAWEYVYPAGAVPWVHGATLCYRKQFWRTHPFPEVKMGEDTRFVASSPGAKLHVLSDNRFFVGLVHPANTSPKRVNDTRWQPRTFDSVRAITGDAWPVAKSAPELPRQVAAAAPAALVSVASGIGDVVRVTPLIRVFHRLGYRVDVLVAPDSVEAADLLRGAPEISNVFLAPSAMNGRPAQQVAELAHRQYEIATFTVWSMPFAQQVKATRQLCFARAEWLGAGDNVCVERLARSLGWQESLPPPFVMTSGRDFALPPGTVALHPGCKPDWPWKKWHGFEELARRFANVVIIGTASDLENTGTYFGSPFQWPDHVRNFAGQLSLADTAALIRQCDALISNDSGLMHVGVALGVPTFGIFGITSPAREAMTSPYMTVVSKGLDCEQACRRGAWGRRDCERHLECLKSLTPGEVAERVMARVPQLAKVAPPAAGLDKTQPAIRLAYYGGVFDATGYGQAARAYVHALHAAGIQVSVVDTGARPAQVEDPVVSSLLGHDPKADFHLFHGIPPYWARTAYSLRNVIAMTVWETDTMPSGWRNPLTHAVDVWLPCSFNVDVFARALGRQPFCLPHPLVTRNEGDGTVLDLAARGISPDDYLFYSCFEWQDRKNPNGMLEAFLRAFPEDTGAVLLLKSNPGAAAVAQQVLYELRGRYPSTARVVLCCEAWNEAQIEALHTRGNCYVSLHKGEGWGYPLFEAACRGKPVVATAYSGPLDYLDPEAHWLVRATPAPVRQRYFYYGPKMKWAEPDLTHAAEGLRWVASHRDATKATAMTAAERLRITYASARIGAAARKRLMDLLRNSNPARALEIVQVAREHLAPPQPIPPDWYDADYFENGIKSNWKSGYTWPLFKGVFCDAAAYLQELFPEARSFLDVGCGKGFLVRALRERELEARGFDHSPWAIGHADPVASSYLQLADVATVSEFDLRFDVVVGMSIFESLTEGQIDALLPRLRKWTQQALFAVIADVPREEEGRRAKGDLSHISLHSRAWWLERFARAGWHQDALHRAFERAARAHPTARRMGWSVYVLEPGHPQVTGA